MSHPHPISLCFLLILALCVASVAAADEAKEPLPYHDGATTLVVIPDTEGYAGRRPQIFNAMMQWIADNKEKRNIEYILHVGDITNRNTEREWKNVRKAFDLIEGKIPYVLAAGNHDYDGTPGRLTHMNDYFKAEDQKKWPTFGDVFEPGKLENHYQFLTINGQKWIVLSLEMGPRKAVVDWANKVLDENKDRRAIILTHGYLYYGNQRYNHLLGGQRASPYNFYGEGADGEMLWNELVRKHPNVMLVICGHLSSGYVGYRADEADYGNTVHQMMCDYEKMKGGRGFLRVLEFLPDGKTVQVRTYSPVTGGTNPINAELEEYTFELQGPTRDEPKKVSSIPKEPLSSPPTHRYSFDGTGGDEATLTDSAGDLDGKLHAPNDGARLNGEGQLVIDSNDGGCYGELDVELVKGREETSFEVWFTPTATNYRWDEVVQFRGGKDGFYYLFRTLKKHRAELIRSGHNEDIQRGVGVEVGKPMQVVVTYDQDGADGRPQIASYVNGRQTGKMTTSIKLSELGLEFGKIGSFDGEFDELRFYDYPLTAKQVQGNWQEGPESIVLAK